MRLVFYDEKGLGGTVYRDNLGLRSWGRICNSLFLFVSLLRWRDLDEPNRTIS